MAAGGPGQGFEITPEEERFLRAFFRRHAARYIAAVALVSVAAVAGAVWMGPGLAQSGAGAWSQAADELREHDAALRSELGAARAEGQALRTELDALAEQLGSLDRDDSPDPQLEKRVSKALKLAERLRDRVAGLEKGVERIGSRTPETAPSPDLGAVLERLDSVEARQEIEARGRETFEKSVLNRLYAVENALSRGASQPTPLSPHP